MAASVGMIVGSAVGGWGADVGGIVLDVVKYLADGTRREDVILASRDARLPSASKKAVQYMSRSSK